MMETCEWSEDDSGMWTCSKCDIAWEFTCDGPKENDLIYCPKCGRKVINTSYYQDWVLEDKA